ncbi:hypothetical protein HN748_03095 [Candidatus Peregrinibacteria bacterium]|jgi:hypothetical protein|nr:hypothetical protein [Candidatus Peregrinibacteria bacterium]MBT7484086.1 hypothetical protein [Candidatus Peregrinibacteria bacterium]MBT7703194.1 hypothetical protein [Candidatus Peregrinibacteria bacterium]
MKPDISHLLTELYSADPSLKEHEKVLEPILKKLIAAKPEAPINEQFKIELRQEVWKQIEAKQTSGQSWWVGVPRWAYAVSGATLAALILVPTILIDLNKTGTINSESPLQNIYEESSNEDEEEWGRGGMGTMQDSADAITYIPYATFTYSYKGDELILDGDSSEIFTKKIFDNTATQVNNWLTDLDLDLIDLEGFEEFKMSYLTIEPEDDIGYSVSFDYANNMISLSYWDENSWEGEWDYSSSNKRMSIEAVVQIVEDFITDYDLDLTGYGDLIIEDQVTYNGYVESYMTVIYPIEQDGLILYDAWGSPEGISITVSVDNERVDSLWGLSPQNYSSSLYDTMTDEDRIIEIAEQGGYNNYIDLYADNIVDLDLGTPFEGLTKIYDYDGSEYLERLVPALIFPVTEYHVENYTDYIVVPLIEEFLGDEYPDEPTHFTQEEAVG